MNLPTFTLSAKAFRMKESGIAAPGVAAAASANRFNKSPKFYTVAHYKSE
jgi:hypothetical protein